MALSVINFAALPPSGQGTGASILEGLQRGLGAGADFAALRQKLKSQKLQDKLAQLDLQYGPQMKESELASKGIQMELAKQELKYNPLKYLLDWSNTMRTNQRFGKAYELSNWLKTMAPAARDQWIGEHQDAYQQMLEGLGENALNDQDNMNGFLSKVGPQFFKDLIPNQENLTITPEEAKKLGAQGIGTPGGNVNASIPEQKIPGPSSPFASTPQQIQTIKDAQAISANDALITPATRAQLDGAVQVEQLMNSEPFRRQSLNASKYAGIMNRPKKEIDDFLNKNPSAYNDYRSFVDQTIPALANRVKKLEDMSSSDAQREELHRMFNFTLNEITSNPGRMLNQVNNLGEMLDQVAKGVFQSANPLGTRPKRLSGIKKISDKEIYTNGYRKKAGNAEYIYNNGKWYLP